MEQLNVVDRANTYQRGAGLLREAVARADELGRKFEIDDMDSLLIEAAEVYVRVHTTNPDSSWLNSPVAQFMLDMDVAVNRNGGLTRGQAKGVLNVLRNEVGRERETAAKAHHTSPVATAATPSFRASAAALPDGLFTVVHEDGSHHTYRVATKKQGSLKGKRVVSYLAGADNESDYQGFAFLADDGRIQVWKRYRDDTALVAGFAVLAQGGLEAARNAGEAYALHSGRCWNCNRTLTHPVSLHRGLGPICAEALGF